MMEEKPEYKAGNEPPNLRRADCCERCKLSAYLSSGMLMQCWKYNCKVMFQDICDSYDPEYISSPYNITNNDAENGVVNVT